MGEQWFRWEGENLYLHLRVQPRASRDEFVAPYGEQYKLRITAPPIEGKANAHLIRFLAKAFGVGKEQVTLISGESCKNKGFRIEKPMKLPIPLTKTEKN
jgi:uncharacterized protein (TIGR00251 family)